MSSWLNQHCLSFMFVSQKPHFSGNKYHLIANGDQGKPMMWCIKLQEGKDQPKIVKIYSDFCVAARILALHDVGVYRQSLIKTRGQY
ncbi:hypothetical protein ACHAXS_000228 [Conticribra weissflogii]